MSVTHLTSREFNQDTARAKKAARTGPVFIIDRGRPAHVLLSIEEYWRLVGGGKRLLDAVAAWDAGDFDFEPPDRRSGAVPRARSRLMYLLDTNVVSALRRLDKGEPRLRAWAAEAPLAQLYLSVVTILEIERSILLVERRDAKQAAILRRWLDRDVLSDLGGGSCPSTSPWRKAAPVCMCRIPRSDRDALIAATALVHGMTVVTRNVADFVATGVSLLNPWEEPVEGDA